MITITKSFGFEASHNLPCHRGKCFNLHGHSYKLDVTVGGIIQDNVDRPDHGMIMDFAVLKELVNRLVVDKYDHKYLNDFFRNPTAEVMVQKIAQDIGVELPEGVHLVSCKLWETATSYAEYRPCN